MADPTNTEIALALDELGDLYELDGAIIHRIVAYRNAAKAVRDAPVSVTALARQGRATELPGIGATIQEKVLALAGDGVIPAAARLRAKFPPGLVDGVGHLLHVDLRDDVEGRHSHTLSSKVPRVGARVAKGSRL